ncbi:MAG: sigma-70 family RNA polymerase sigma factor [Elusimicrobia bacterium]|nr:sigma-70 family RNA polymerase sigma factor [Elusimicrobiota bacterium]
MEPGNFSDPKGSKISKESFEPLFRQHGARLYALSVRLCGNTSDGEDLAQETFITAYRRINQFRGEADFGSWAYRICVNLWKNRVRYEKRRMFWKHISIFGDDKGEDDPRPMEIADPKDRTDAPAETAERQRLVQDALAKLDPHERAALALREMEDKSYEEIADLLDLPLGTVKSRIARARATLKERLAPLLRDL